MLEDSKKFELEDDALEAAAGGAQCDGIVYTVKGVDQYLALRTACSYRRENEIGGLKNGEKVHFIMKGDNGYWLVYSPKLNSMGFVNANYLKR